MQIATHDHRWQSALNHSFQRVDFDEQPVCYHDQPFHATVDQHLQVTSKPSAVVVCVHDDRQILCRLQSFIDSSQNQCAKRIREIENHYSDGIAALTS